MFVVLGAVTGIAPLGVAAAAWRKWLSRGRCGLHEVDVMTTPPPFRLPNELASGLHDPDSDMTAACDGGRCISPMPSNIFVLMSSG